MIALQHTSFDVMGASKGIAVSLFPEFERKISLTGFISKVVAFYLDNLPRFNPAGADKR